MEPFVAFLLSTVVPVWIERFKKWTSFSGNELLSLVCILAGMVYIIYAMATSTEYTDAGSVAQKLFFVCTSFWAGASGTYGLVYKYYFKGKYGPDTTTKPDTPHQTTEDNDI